ncbi:MAG TPA: cytochrome c oxidase subunit II [Rhizomicrobium sp.]|nr:cytochrome c oxidase subunit II [Rhizomicrobium sp.]
MPLAFVSPAGAAPLEYLTGAGEKAASIVSLTWGVIIISIAVIVIIAALLVGAIWRRPGLALRPGEKSPLVGDQGGLDWLWGGVGLTSLVLLFSVAWTMVVLARVEAPKTSPSVTIEITGKQWWWRARYIGPDAARDFVTADEIHIPAGEAVRIRLIGGDVIHSFWVPQLAGKMDAIPGQTNETWLEADRPGSYLGQCTEYCGLQHAHMGLKVIADTPAGFHAWWNHQLQTPSSGGMPGRALFENHCGGCHTVRGTEAAGVLGPDLSHLMARTTLAAATLSNDRASLARWISDPQHVKPGSLMPVPELSGAELIQVQSYLETLK